FPYTTLFLSQLEVGAVQRREYLFYFTTRLPRVQTGNYSDILKRINAVSKGHIFITRNEIVKLRRKRVVRQRLRHREQRRDTNSARHEDRSVTVSSQGEIVAGQGNCYDIERMRGGYGENLESNLHV